MTAAEVGALDGPGRAVREGARFRIAALGPGDAQAVIAMLGRCSPATRYHRFHGVTDGRSHVTQLLAEIPDHGAYGAWIGGSCVGLASLAVDSRRSAQIGLLVEDRWQRCGAGSALMAALVARARHLRLRVLEADVLADDRFLLGLLARIGPITVAFGYGGYSVAVDLEEARPRVTPRPADARLFEALAPLACGFVRAGDGNRTRMTSLEGWHSTIELHPRAPTTVAASGPGGRGGGT
jgi:GNAT superfamily N-acetyltransferase